MGRILPQALQCHGGVLSGRVDPQDFECLTRVVEILPAASAMPSMNQVSSSCGLSCTASRQASSHRSCGPDRCMPQFAASAASSGFSWRARRVRSPGCFPWPQAPGPDSKDAGPLASASRNASLNSRSAAECGQCCRRSPRSCGPCVARRRQWRATTTLRRTPGRRLGVCDPQVKRWPDAERATATRTVARPPSPRLHARA